MTIDVLLLAAPIGLLVIGAVLLLRWLSGIRYDRHHRRCPHPARRPFCSC